MGDNNSRMTRFNIILYDSGLCAERKPCERDVVWFSEKLSSYGVALDCGTGYGCYLSSLVWRDSLDISAR